MDDEKQSLYTREVQPPRYLPEKVENERHGPASRLTEELAQRIAAEVRQGATPKRAAALCGVPLPTFKTWLSKAKDRIEPYYGRMSTIAMAQASWEAVAEQCIANAGKWEGLAWLLKTRNRLEYGDKVAIQDERTEAQQLTRDELIAIATGKDGDQQS